MKFKLFEQVALAKDIPEENLRRGDVATIVDSHSPRQWRGAWLFNRVL